MAGGRWEGAVLMIETGNLLLVEWRDAAQSDHHTGGLMVYSVGWGVVEGEDLVLCKSLYADQPENNGPFLAIPLGMVRRVWALGPRRRRVKLEELAGA